ncbi:MAG TPA: enoyl-ACP reductase [Planctomycetota bacterium]
MLLEGKHGAVFGVANKNSLAWHIAQACHREGATQVLAVAGERFQDKARPLASTLDAGEPLTCDVTDDASIERCFAEIATRLPKLDFLVHSIAFADRSDLEARFHETRREGFALAQDISAFSLVALAKAARPLLAPDASILTLSYIGAVRAVPGYNVMGVAKASLESCVRYLACDLGPDSVRVNAISAGPVKTLSSSAIKGLKAKIDLQDVQAPLRRSLRGEEVGSAAAFLLSDLASGITGEVLYVDCGYHALGAFL